MWNVNEWHPEREYATYINGNGSGTVKPMTPEEESEWEKLLWCGFDSE